MPVIKFSAYGHFLHLFRNGHLETIWSSIFRKSFKVNFERERIDTPDEDFLDLDWIHNQSEKLIILSHGLEGNSRRPYMLSMSKYFSDRGFDVLSWNYRSCSDEINKQLRLYHHGVTDDLETVVTHAIDTRKYKKIGLVGFSMGGSTTIKYLGENGYNTPKHVVAAATFSVPCNLWNSALQLTDWKNSYYKNRFLKKMIKKVKRKHEQFPDKIDITGIDKINSFGVFDERYTAPLHGFRNARHFYKTSTSDLHYSSVKVPALIVNAKNDPMLGDSCYPFEACKNHQYLFLETPLCGGHVGFGLRKGRHNWMDIRAHQFISKFTD
ncbi:MAG: alpha/beta fold hydrolase [Reichenbachiella sp.]